MLFIKFIKEDDLRKVATGTRTRKRPETLTVRPGTYQLKT